MTQKAEQHSPVVVQIRSVEGQDTEQPAESLELALKMAKAARTQINRMVKVLNAGVVLHRWDRSNVVGENRWRKVNQGEIEILGNPAPIIVVRRPRVAG